MFEKIGEMRRDRAFVVLLILLLLGGAAYALRETGGGGWMPGCAFKKLTGYDCPGCGMTRASYATLHGNIAQAFRFNPVGMILLPLALVAIGIELIGWVRGKPLPFRIRTGKWGATVLLAIILAWWVLRNLFWKL